MRSVSFVFLDAGGTLVDVEYRYLREVLVGPGADGQPPDEAFERGEREARAWFLGRMREGGAPLDAWKGYFERVYRGAGVSENRLPDLLDRLWERNLRDGLWHRPVSGAAETLERLERAGFRLAVISNAEGRVADDLAQAGLARWFETIVDSHEVGVAKPDPRIFEIALGRMGARPEEAVYVGDIHAFDVVGARAAGLQAILIDRWGLQEDSDSLRVGRIEDVTAILDRL